MSAEDMMNEKHVPAQEGIIQEYSTTFDESSEKITTTIGHGRCSGCGEIDASKYYLCTGGELLCKNCVIIHEGKVYCREHIESDLGSKQLAKLLVGIICKLGIDKIKKFSKIKNSDIQKLKQELVDRDYITEKGIGFFIEKKLNDRGISAAKSFVKAYSQDLDFQVFIKKILELRPDWQEVLSAS